ncbi:hypothetical protein SAMN05519103_08961 [Rhizobiales bacterium GAS113]|nr:hypothetical protein SAMN05519103_08961 [Rhizobiales bacterium GAS113]
MTHARFISMAALPFLLSASLCLPCAEVLAQTQPQGMTVGSPPPPPKPADKKAMRAKCVAEAKGKGLKGRALRTFVATCMKG